MAHEYQEMTSEQAAPKPAAAAEAEDRVHPVVIPAEVLDLVRFLAATWDEIDRWAYAECGGSALMKYPVVQGTRNQIAMRRIGEQPHNTRNIHKAVDWMLSYSEDNRP